MPQAEYRDHYEGRGKYARENDVMLDQERSRLGAWRKESTDFKPVVAAPVLAAALLAVIAVTIAAVLYYFLFAGQ